MTPDDGDASRVGTEGQRTRITPVVDEQSHPAVRAGVEPRSDLRQGRAGGVNCLWTTSEVDF